MNILTLILCLYIFSSISRGSLINELGKISRYYKPRVSSKSLREYVDLTVDPCDNIYKFSCGNWITAKAIETENETSYYYTDFDSNFNKFVIEALNGKYNTESIAIKDIYNLIIKCRELPNNEAKDCDQEVYEFGLYAFSSLFVVKNRVESEILNDDYIIIEDMVKRIKEEFKLLLEEKGDKIDKETRYNFLDKLNAIEFVRNLDPYELSNTSLMEDCYKNIGVQYDDNIESVLETIKYYRSKLKDSSTSDPCNIKVFQYEKYLRAYVHSNAMYNSMHNKFMLNSDTLKEPSFNRYFLSSLNYGFVGFTIAHEILHAFDNDNYHYRFLTPELVKSIVSDEFTENFKEKSNCFIKQYEKQRESKATKNVDGKKTLSENIADNGGLKIVHRAYMKYLQSIGGEEPKVPGFEDFTSEQLFFISVGRNFCVHKSDEYFDESVTDKVHTPSEIRTNVALSNYEPFSNAFKCKLNSSMNPEHKCDLWLR
uniref:Phosphate-regulating neutral endopeptidase (inferred by orthology to a human protein) n=1 Tax=Strongyloides venezuelensis TaxID=75913 RepID=A0A0K0FNH3_STRVS